LKKITMKKRKQQLQKIFWEFQDNNTVNTNQQLGAKTARKLIILVSEYYYLDLGDLVPAQLL